MRGFLLNLCFAVLLATPSLNARAEEDREGISWVRGSWQDWIGQWELMNLVCLDGDLTACSAVDKATVWGSEGCPAVRNDIYEIRAQSAATSGRSWNVLFWGLEDIPQGFGHAEAIEFAEAACRDGNLNGCMMLVPDASSTNGGSLENQEDGEYVYRPLEKAVPVQKPASYSDPVFPKYLLQRGCDEGKGEWCGALLDLTSAQLAESGNEVERTKAYRSLEELACLRGSAAGCVAWFQSSEAGSGEIPVVPSTVMAGYVLDSADWSVGIGIVRKYCSSQKDGEPEVCNRPMSRCNEGDAVACRQAAALLQDSPPGLPLSDGSLEYLARACRIGDGAACLMLYDDRVLRLSNTVLDDTGARYLEASCRLGTAAACGILGEFYASPESGDMARSAYYLRGACLLGSASSCALVAQMFLQSAPDARETRLYLVLACKYGASMCFEAGRAFGASPSGENRDYWHKLLLTRGCVDADDRRACLMIEGR